MTTEREPVPQARELGRLAARVPKRLVCLAAAAALLWAVAPAGSAHADTSLIGWTSQADANAVDFVIDNAAGLAGSHPLAEGDIPEDASDYETGPFGHGLASIVWPGGTAGNLGSLSGELGLPSQIAPLVAQANDPVRAETFFPAGPTDATYPAGNTSGALEMVSRADGNGTTAKSALADFSVSGLFDVKGVSGTSLATATDSAQSSALGSFSSLSILGGLVTVGATTSSATASSDGNEPIGHAYTHVGEITVEGHQVSVGTDGLTVGPLSTNAPNSFTGVTVAQVNQFISAFHLSITPLPQVETSQAPAEEITAGGLKISMALPPDASVNLDCSALNSLPSQFSQLQQLGVLCTLPGFLQGSSLTLTLGRSTATAIATPPFPVDLGGSGGTGVLGNVGGPGTAAGVAASMSTLSGGSASPSLAGTPVTTPSAGRSPSSTGALGALTPAALSEPVKAGLLVSLLILAAIAGAGLVRMTRHIPDLPPASNCPLEEGP
jgi:hypothetical protein